MDKEKLDDIKYRILCLNDKRGIPHEKEVDSLFKNLCEECHEVVEAVNDDFGKYSVIGELCDVVVFAITAIPETEKVGFQTFVLAPLQEIEKRGFDSYLCMLETIKKVESRKGRYDGTKWVKDKSLEASKQWYEPSYANCRKDEK